MSTEEDGHTLTRKQLRELRLTGSTPVVSGEEAAAARAAQTGRPNDAPAESAPAEQHSTESHATEPHPAVEAEAEPAPVESNTAEPTPVEPAASSASPSPASAVPLTRRAARAQERGRADSGAPAEQPSAAEEPVEARPVVSQPVVEEPVVEPDVVEEPVVEPDVVEEPVVEEPVVEELIVDVPVAVAPAVASQEAQPAASGPDVTPSSPAEDVAKTDAEPERPMVGAAFGIGVKRSPSGPGMPTAFDDLLETGSAGSHKTSSTLIFTPSPGAGSLSGPVASTGELLITGTYALPDGMGSQGHALGTTDGKDVDAVLIDGELAPASSPTPIAASSAISTSKPAGEVIRPPVPDKGSKLTLTLAIVAGGLALALAAALIIAFTTGVLA
ncbi:hypothetical protein [Microbacterium sp. NPDC055521]